MIQNLTFRYALTLKFCFVQQNAVMNITGMYYLNC